MVRPIWLWFFIFLLAVLLQIKFNQKIFCLYMYFLCYQGPPGDRGERGESGDPGYKVRTTDYFKTSYLDVLMKSFNVMFLRVKLVWMENEADLELLDNQWVTKLECHAEHSLCKTNTTSIHAGFLGMLSFTKNTYFLIAGSPRASWIQRT